MEAAEEKNAKNLLSHKVKGTRAEAHRKWEKHKGHSESYQGR